MELSEKQFERSVDRAVGRIPPEIRDRMHNLIICIEDRPSPDLLADMCIPPDETLFGLYTGIPLPGRSLTEPPLYPDEIIIFKEPLVSLCRSIEELEEEIEITVVHEVAHYLGFDERRLEELGYG
jgi:predicted Zn-dependent protease with MMP-like domain